MNKIPLSNPCSKNNKKNFLLSRVALLKEVMEHPEKFSENSEVLLALKSQGGLAKLSIAESFIYPMSLNTLKAKSNELLPGGFKEIDNLRLKAADCVAASRLKAKNCGSKTKKDLKVKVKEQEVVICQLWNEIALITNVLRESFSLAKQFAEKCPSPSDQAHFKKRHRELLLMLGLGGAGEHMHQEVNNND